MVLIFFPKVPNATNVTQEIDQKFGLFKAKVYTNRDQLWLERQVASDQELSREDFGLIIFDGDVELQGGKVLRYKNLLKTLSLKKR